MNNRVGSNRNLLIYYYGFHSLFTLFIIIIIISLLIYLNQNLIVSVPILRTQHMKQMCTLNWLRCPMFYCLDHIWFRFYVRIRLALFGDTVCLFCVFFLLLRKKKKENRYALIRTFMWELYTFLLFFVFFSLVRLDRVPHFWLFCFYPEQILLARFFFFLEGCFLRYRIKFYSNTATQQHIIKINKMCVEFRIWNEISVLVFDTKIEGRRGGRRRKIFAAFTQWKENEYFPRAGRFVEVTQKKMKALFWKMKERMREREEENKSARKNETMSETQKKTLLEWLQ